ncbi:MAG TPA: cyclic nucleotide-binding domain-containing protein, partial [Candidatus Ozemobacteraceae bacterium]|nr:cyclic nucleotide-binding domain-containing protein [Candidatus Ozemobacteraceae bacterium]
EDMNMLASLMEEVEYEPKELIVGEKQETTHLYFLLSGRAQIYKMSSGQVNILTVLEKNDLFGEVSFVDRQVRSACVSALDKCSVAILKLEHFDVIKKQAPAFGMDLLMALMKELTRRFRAVNEGLDIKSPEYVIQELILSGQQVMVNTKSGQEYICIVKASDRSQSLPMLKIGIQSGQTLMIPFHEIKAIVFPNKFGKY